MSYFKKRRKLEDERAAISRRMARRQEELSNPMWTEFARRIGAKLDKQDNERLKAIDHELVKNGRKG